MKAPKVLFVNLYKQKKILSNVTFEEGDEYPAHTQQDERFDKYVHGSEHEIVVSTLRAIVKNPEKAKEIASNTLFSLNIKE